MAKISGLLTVAFMVAGAGFAAADNGAKGVAVVADLAGKVMVNSGKGFVPATALLSLKPGDRVLVGENAFATLSFETCSLALDKPVVFTVTDKVACNSPGVQPVADLPGGGAYPPAGGAGVPAAGALAPAVLPLLVIGPVVVGCAIKCKDLLDNSEDPVSGG